MSNCIQYVYKYVCIYVCKHIFKYFYLSYVTGRALFACSTPFTHTHSFIAHAQPSLDLERIVYYVTRKVNFDLPVWPVLLQLLSDSLFQLRTCMFTIVRATKVAPRSSLVASLHL